MRPIHFATIPALAVTISATLIPPVEYKHMLMREQDGHGGYDTTKRDENGRSGYDT
jgi:hypothetical protein